MLIILGVIVKLDNNGEYCAKVWFDSSAIVINNVIYVEEGNENITGMITG